MHEIASPGTSISKMSQRSIRLKLPKKCALNSPDGHYRAYVASVYYISRPHLSSVRPCWPLTDRQVPSKDPRSSCKTHFGSSLKGDYFVIILS